MQPAAHQISPTGETGQSSSAVAPALATSAAPAIQPTGLCLWGLSALNLHDAYWRSKGVQCVRRGQTLLGPAGTSAGGAAVLQRAADLYLLLEPEQMVLFNIGEMIERLTWHNATVTRLRLIDQAQGTYSEHVVTDRPGPGGLVLRIERRYRAPVRGSSRVMLTSSRRVAAVWLSSRNRREGWDRARRSVAWARVDHWKCVGRTFMVGDPEQERQLIDDLVERWPHPNQSIAGLQEAAAGVWHATGDTLDAGAVRIGPLWLGQGAGDADSSARCLVGPAWLADRPQTSRQRRQASLKEIADVELPESAMEDTVDLAPPRRVYRAFKRAFDVVVSVVALAVLMPVLLLVALGVWLDDGLPLFFGHERQGRQGRVFKCWKFRTMKRGAQQMADQLAHENLCDGPQVNIKNDPRVLRIGRILRKTNLDELPQFWNVLRGDMSLVGPRPSPDKENQYCPAWRDSRLSVRPGITGLWQLNRTREPGEDFQEWIKYDIEYVQRASFSLDLLILFRTALLVLRGRASSASE
jgi:lipopolysaccharide/colanic/teichoic acid biosynthesis glycosyltransferase